MSKGAAHHDEGGVATYHNAVLAATAVLVRTGVGRMYGFHLGNGANAARTYLQIFDKAAAADVTPGTTVPKIAFEIAASSQLTLDFSKPIGFTLGIVVFVATAVGGGTAPGTAVPIDIWFN